MVLHLYPIYILLRYRCMQANFLLFYCNFTVTFAFVYGLKNERRVRATVRRAATVPQRGRVRAGVAVLVVPHFLGNNLPFTKL